MATRADRQAFQAVRWDRGRETAEPAGAEFVSIKFPVDVTGARTLGELKFRTQQNLDALALQVERELNRIGRFFDADGYPRISSAKMFSRVKVE